MLSRTIIATLAACLIGACDGSSSREIAGAASLIDGDTIEIHGRRIRLHGIVASEFLDQNPMTGWIKRASKPSNLSGPSVAIRHTQPSRSSECG
jgi:endonuclease YncB( thermonuclease family)